MGFQKVSDNPTVQAHYEASRRSGASHRIAEIVAFRRTPGVRTAKRWRSRGGRSGIERDSLWPLYRQMAEDAGVNVESNVYVEEIAKYPGDPRAWCRDLGDVKRRCVDEGWAASGAVNVKPQGEPEPEPEPGLSQRDIGFCVAQEIKEQGIAASDQQEFGRVRSEELSEYASNVS